MFLSLDITKNQKSDFCSSWCIYSHTEFTFIVSKEVCLWDNKWVLKGNRIWLIRTQHAHTYRHMKVSTDWVLYIYNSGVTCGDTFINRCSHLSNQSFPNKKNYSYFNSWLFWMWERMSNPLSNIWEQSLVLLKLCDFWKNDELYSLRNRILWKKFG